METGRGRVFQNTDSFVAAAQKLRLMLARYQITEDASKLYLIEGQLRQVGDTLNLDVELDELTAKSK